MRRPKPKPTEPPVLSPIAESLEQEAENYQALWDQTESPTLNQLFYGVYLPEKKSHAQRKDPLSRYTNYIKGPLGSIKVDVITPFHIRTLLNSLPADMAIATRNRVRAVLHRLLQIAVEYSFIARNPCTVIKAERENNIVERYMTDEEIQAFRDACEEEWSEPTALALLLALFTGIRIGNVISIKREDLSPGNREVNLPKTKSGKAQRFPLGEWARRVVEQALTISTNDYLFSSPIRAGKPISYPRKAFVRICKRAGISVNSVLHSGRDGFLAEPLTIHCLRKTFASQILKRTGDIYLCSKLLGHSDVSVTQRYAFYRDKELDQTVEKAFCDHLPKAG